MLYIIIVNAQYVLPPAKEAPKMATTTTNKSVSVKTFACYIIAGIMGNIFVFDGAGFFFFVAVFLRELFLI